MKGNVALAVVLWWTAGYRAVLAQPAAEGIRADQTKAMVVAPAQPIIKLPSTAACPVNARLTTFKHLENTLILADCIDVPAAVVVSADSDVKLYIVARKKLTVSGKVVFESEGKVGGTGDAGSSKCWGAYHTEYTAARDGTNCAPGETQPGGANYDLVGKKGKPGLVGGTIKIAAVTPSKEFVVDVVGGPGGPPGDSGHLKCYCLNDCAACDPRHCKDGEYRDGTPARKEGFGDQGPAGKISVAFIGSGSSAMLAQVKALAQPNVAVIHAQAYGAAEAAKFKSTEVDPLVDEANKNSWRKLPGP